MQTLITVATFVHSARGKGKCVGRIEGKTRSFIDGYYNEYYNYRFVLLLLLPQMMMMMMMVVVVFYESWHHYY